MKKITSRAEFLEYLEEQKRAESQAAENATLKAELQRQKLELQRQKNELQKQRNELAAQRIAEQQSRQAAQQKANEQRDRYNRRERRDSRAWLIGLGFSILFGIALPLIMWLIVLSL